MLDIESHTPTFVFVEELVAVFCRIGFAFKRFKVDFFTIELKDEENEVEDDIFPLSGGVDVRCLPLLEEDDDGEVDLILLISATKAEARFLTMESW